MSRKVLGITFLTVAMLMISLVSTFNGTSRACDEISCPKGAILVPGTSDPWLAGMLDGSSASKNPGSSEPADFAPKQSPVLVGMPISGGMMLQWTATVALSDTGAPLLVGHPQDLAYPDGAVNAIYSHFGGAENGISDIKAPIDSLLGVFLGSSPVSAPSPLDFSTPESRDYSILTNLALQQVFFMGDGVTSGSVPQTIIAPAGAKWLYLGTMDGYSWNNNIGAFCVTMSAVPEPTTLLLLGLGMAGLAGIRRKCKK